MLACPIQVLGTLLERPALFLSGSHRAHSGSCNQATGAKTPSTTMQQVERMGKEVEGKTGMQAYESCLLYTSRCV